MRTRLGALLAIAAVTMAGMTSSVVAAEGEAVAGRFDRPQLGFAPPGTTLRPATPEEAGLDPAPLVAAEQKIDAWTRPDSTGHPLFAGAVGVQIHDGMIVNTHTAGSALRYADGAGTELPAGQQVPMRMDTIFDLASISKLFTSLAVMQLIEAGQVRVDEPVATYLPEFGVNGKAGISVGQLLTHTSGLEPFLPLWRDWPDKAARVKAVMDVKPMYEPGSTYKYSDLNLITLGVLVERLTGQPLDARVRERITEPLGMVDTGYNPPAEKLDRVAATEFMAVPDRGMIRGQVHDENAWSLGGVAGHAGVFSTAADLSRLGQAILNGGAYDGQRILREDSVRQMLTDYNQAFPGNAHGLGFELDQLWYMGGLTSPATAGHTGFTGTSLVIDPTSRSIAILLTNRVHPTRTWGSINIARETWATGLARSLAVPPKHGPDAWFTEIGNLSTATLTTKPLTLGSRPLRVTFDAFVDTEPTDQLVLESTVDGTSWQPVSLRAVGPGAPGGEVTALSGTGHRSWWAVSALVRPSEIVALRWRYTTDKAYTARGVLLDGVKAVVSGNAVLDLERAPEAVTPERWQLRSR
ncbi:serine hydrolase domain-containing protein [Amycolatopsis magusensis]|uniref:CubicO group peptidase (Beta-lactamase class C family) n=1 Tax=Amycolatopsis magusensis TaxID=882444 RepID=A0ABS4PIN4_9PSEU|nr:serine hydrolase domain-containing protein [Amycolatopsis magusensis]MBP2179283.1 CubicO group peptidase (beta-lactamase class C family) [Amycolatopsis magusensis]MDI5978884.1 serine hydrolase domain-containing protein [Amycolatopsis magusensis]